MGHGTMNALGSSRKMAHPNQPAHPTMPAPPAVSAEAPPPGPPELKRETTSSLPKKKNAWMEHVKAFRASNPNLSFKDVLKQAKNTYKK